MQAPSKCLLRARGSGEGGGGTSVRPLTTALNGARASIKTVACHFIGTETGDARIEGSRSTVDLRGQVSSQKANKLRLCE